MNLFKDALNDKGIKPTYQRLKILEYMNETIKNHPTAEMIHEALVRDIPTISLTTVYNTMSTLLEKRLVDAVTITGKEFRYDSNTSPHHHFLCKKCGRIFDLEVSCPFGQGKKKLIAGHRIEEVHGYFKGTCSDCSKQGSLVKNNARHGTIENQKRLNKTKKRIMIDNLKGGQS